MYGLEVGFRKGIEMDWVLWEGSEHAYKTELGIRINQQPGLVNGL